MGLLSTKAMQGVNVSGLSPLSAKIVFTVCSVYAPTFWWVLSAFQNNINNNSIVILSGLTVCASLPVCTVWLFPSAVRRESGIRPRPAAERLAILAGVTSPLIAGLMVWLALFSVVLIPDQALGGGYLLRLAGLLLTLPAANWFTVVNWSSALQPLRKIRCD